MYEMATCELFLLLSTDDSTDLTTSIPSGFLIEISKIPRISTCGI
jgi:hypothetical protein